MESIVEESLEKQKYLAVDEDVYNPADFLETSIDPTDELYPIAVLIDEMRNDNVQLRLNSITNVKTIAFALGPERTRNELIPYLTDKIHDDDEILSVMALKLGDFISLVGGIEYCHLILKPLEMLCSNEDTQVRKRTMESLTKIIDNMDISAINEHVVPMIHRLHKAEWYSMRCACSCLLINSYLHSDEDTQSEFRNLYISLLQDPVAMVRRATVSRFTNFIKVVDFRHVYEELVPIFQTLISDGQDSVRFMVAEEFADAIKILVPSEVFDETNETSDIQERKKCIIDDNLVEKFFNFLEDLVNDCSWRVRCVIAKNIFKFQESFGKCLSNEKIAKCYGKLLKDDEPEVKSAASLSFTDFMNAVREEEREGIYTSIFSECIVALSSDVNEYVKISLSSVIMKLSKTMGIDFTISDLLPIYLQLLKDECSNVRLNIISNLNYVNNVIGMTQLTECLLPAMFDLANDEKWRVRLAILTLTPVLASQLGEEFFNKEFLSICFKWLDDPVYEIRRSAAITFDEIIQNYGKDWANEKVVPQLVLKLETSSNYLRRLSIINCLAVISEPCGTEIVENNIIPALIKLTEDKISNVRFNVCKAFLKIDQLISGDFYYQNIEPILNGLIKNDKDSLVKFFAQQTIDNIHKKSIPPKNFD
ncbi:Protein phosphatase PP2A regulatory subunit A [Intoshia linei]|uniref:Protein phosphatase PP2A regulatory subunit A n=1 Tax=Intoshia linei TaxID=1819745 RepID=A0A177BCD9_9BILA|nr:Protein phosphatase PP2A regulatory subunit A [Intoshia linei]